MENKINDNDIKEYYLFLINLQNIKNEKFK